MMPQRTVGSEGVLKEAMSSLNYSASLHYRSARTRKILSPQKYSGKQWTRPKIANSLGEINSNSLDTTSRRMLVTNQ